MKIMESKKEKSTTVSGNGKQSNGKSASSPMRSTQLMQLFEEQLKDIYWAEKALTKEIPKMIAGATSPELIDALTDHLAETEVQVTRLEQVFESIDQKAVAEKCDAMEGLIKEAGAIMKSCEVGAMCDAGIIAAAQKIEHYEIASYGTLRQFAETLGLEEAVSLLETTLQEEKAADERLSEVATDAVNVEAAQEEA